MQMYVRPRSLLHTRDNATYLEFPGPAEAEEEDKDGTADPEDSRVEEELLLVTGAADDKAGLSKTQSASQTHGTRGKMIMMIGHTALTLSSQGPARTRGSQSRPKVRGCTCVKFVPQNS